MKWTGAVIRVEVEVVFHFGSLYLTQGPVLLISHTRRLSPWPQSQVPLSPIQLQGDTHTETHTHTLKHDLDETEDTDSHC